MLPGSGFSLHKGLLMGYPMNDTFFTSGEFLDVSKQFPIRQYQSGAVQFVSPHANATTPLNRWAPNGVSTWGYLLRNLSIFIKYIKQMNECK